MSAYFFSFFISLKRTRGDNEKCIRGLIIERFVLFVYPLVPFNFKNKLRKMGNLFIATLQKLQFIFFILKYLF